MRFPRGCTTHNTRPYIDTCVSLCSAARGRGKKKNRSACTRGEKKIRRSRNSNEEHNDDFSSYVVDSRFYSQNVCVHTGKCVIRGARTKGKRTRVYANISGNRRNSSNSRSHRNAGYAHALFVYILLYYNSRGADLFLACPAYYYLRSSTRHSPATERRSKDSLIKDRTLTQLFNFNERCNLPSCRKGTRAGDVYS